jgi:hypothetical protein
MKIVPFLSSVEDRFLDLDQWHRWFAYVPVDTQEGARVWGHLVYRKAIRHSMGPEPGVAFIYSLAPPEEATK